MSALTTASLEALARDVRLYVFGQAASTARVPQAPQIAEALKHPVEEIHEAPAASRRRQGTDPRAE
jgi:hypothetical protein